jgi:leucyl/phenylalanyl-tRNA--protein transferase
MIPWLVDDAPFPPAEQALIEPNGLLCAGANLSAERILSAYRQGIFPWFSAGQPILWWSPDPRMVLFPSEFKLSRSLRKTLKAGDYTIRLDSHFNEVIKACAHTERAGQPGTWITPDMQRAYRQLHELGWAHSVETWRGDRMIGGLYGLAIGHMFYGESMFSQQTDASKIAVAHLARFLEQHDFGMVDCQMRTEHLASLGAREIPRSDFLARLRVLCDSPVAPGRWPEAGAAFNWIDWS